jgi:hypothetical protein
VNQVEDDMPIARTRADHVDRLMSVALEEAFSGQRREEAASAAPRANWNRLTKPAAGSRRSTRRRSLRRLVDIAIGVLIAALIIWMCFAFCFREPLGGTGTVTPVNAPVKDTTITPGENTK